MDNGGLREKLDQFKIPIGLSLVGIILIIGGVFTSGLNEQIPSYGSKQKPKDFPKESLVKDLKIISVDVSGAVNNPGVYQIKEGSRIEEAILSAGGFSKDANKEYISKYLNMAQLLPDGSKIYVPFTGEQGSAPQTIGAVAGASVRTKVNVNTATQAELEALSGIGPVTASKIISDRPYQRVEDLQSKKVISKTVFEKIKEQLVIY